MTGKKKEMLSGYRNPRDEMDDKSLLIEVDDTEEEVVDEVEQEVEQPVAAPTTRKKK